MTAAKSRRGGARIPGPGKRLGPEPKPIAEKTRIYRKVRVMLDPEQEMVIPVDPETRALAQRLMLNDWPGVERVEELFAYAVRRLDVIEAEFRRRAELQD